MISAYLATLSDRLSFDRALARCVVQEVEDHLYETVEADPARDRRDAERRAIENFGDADVLAAQFAAVALSRRTRRTSVVLVLAIVAVLVLMKLRVAWYVAMQWSIAEDMRALAALVVQVDRVAFWISLVTGIGALLYVDRYCVPGMRGPDYRARLGRAFFLCACAAASLAVTVISDGVLTVLALGSGADPAIPILSMAVEVTCAATVAVLIITTMRRAASAAALFGRG